MERQQCDMFIKTRKLFLCFFVFFCAQTSVSCYQKKKQEEKHHFKVSIDLTTNKEHTIQLFYATNADDGYSEKLSLRRKSKASPNLQKLIFELPFGVKAKNVRIDLGENENINDCLQIENICFEYKNRILNGKNGLYKSWFTFNENVIEGKSGNGFCLKKAGDLFDPQLNGNRELNAKLVKLFPPDIHEK
jgi:hypothetical protein